MENPFKFGTIVEAEYFTDRQKEVAYIRQFVDSPNHLVLISPRRFGKSSVVAKALSKSGRKSITVNQLPTYPLNCCESFLKSIRWSA